MIQGFIQALRVQSKIVFIVVRNMKGLTQIVVTADNSEFEIAKNLTLESVIRATGEMKDTPQAPGGKEMHPTKIEVLSKAEPELPIPVVSQKGGEETDAPIRFDYRWLDLRKPEKALIFKVWTEFEKGWRKYWDKEGFIQLYPPAFMSTPSETGADVFEVKYFDRKAYLAQSPQFYKQMGIASGFEKVFMVGPVFRAELSFTTRHLTEFTGWDFEIAYVNSHEDVMKAEEGMIISGFEQLASSFPELNLEVPRAPFPKITMVEAKKILKEMGVGSGEEHDLSPEEEKAISEYVKKEFNHDFVFITEYHKSKSAFYHMRLDTGSDRSRRADLLYKGIEVTTLAQREHRVEVLEKQAKETQEELGGVTKEMTGEAGVEDVPSPSENPQSNVEKGEING